MRSDSELKQTIKQALEREKELETQTGEVDIQAN